MISFRKFYEERSQEKDVQKMFLRRLGYNVEHDIQDILTAKIRTKNYKDIEKAIDSMSFTSEKAEELKIWVKDNKDARLQDLLSQIKTHDIEPILDDSPEEDDSLVPPDNQKVNNKALAVPPIQQNMQVNQ